MTIPPCGRDYLGIAVAAAIVSGSFGCGGAAPEAAAPATSPAAPPASFAGPNRKDDREEEPTTVEEASARIERARAELGLGPRDAKPAKGEPSPPAPEPAPKPGGPVRPTTPTDLSTESQNPCAGTCRAFASMKRAVEALCRMTGDKDSRCADARRTLDESVARVATCRCSS